MKCLCSGRNDKHIMNQAQFIVVEGFEPTHQLIINKIHKLSDIKLSKIPFEIHKIRFGPLCVGSGQPADLWQFIIDNHNKLPDCVEFSQCIGQTRLIKYFDDQLNKNQISCEMSNHRSAMYTFNENQLSFSSSTKIKTLRDFLSNDNSNKKVT